MALVISPIDEILNQTFDDELFVAYKYTSITYAALLFMYGAYLLYITKVKPVLFLLPLVIFALINIVITAINIEQPKNVKLAMYSDFVNISFIISSFFVLFFIYVFHFQEMKSKDLSGLKKDSSILKEVLTCWKVYEKSLKAKENSFGAKNYLEGISKHFFILCILGLFGLGPFLLFWVGYIKN